MTKWEFPFFRSPSLRPQNPSTTTFWRRTHKTNNLPSLPRGASFGPEEEEEEEGSVISPTGERWRKGPLRSYPVATDRGGIILLRQGSRSSLLVQGSRNIGEFPSVESIRQEVPDPRPAIPRLALQWCPFFVALKIVSIFSGKRTFATSRS